MNVQAVRDEERQLGTEGEEVSNRFAEEYEVLEVVGQGSSSVVRRARVRHSGLEVALKIIRTCDPEHQQIARNEFNILRNLEHPNITKVHDFFVMPTQTVLVVEFFNAKSLQEAVRNVEYRRLAEDVSKCLMNQLLSGLDFLHQHRVIHRDVKPQNLLVAPDMSTLKLIDFNVARKLEEGGSLTLTGTSQYSPPEVLLRESASDGVDVWAAGLCLFYMITGSLPFRIEDFGSNPRFFGEHILQHPVALMGGLWDGVSEPCKRLLRQCLAVDKSARPAPMTLLKSDWFPTYAPRRHLGAGIFDTEELPSSPAYAGDFSVFDTAPI